MISVFNKNIYYYSMHNENHFNKMANEEHEEEGVSKLSLALNIFNISSPPAFYLLFLLVKRPGFFFRGFQKECNRTEAVVAGDHGYAVAICPIVAIEFLHAGGERKNILVHGAPSTVAHAVWAGIRRIEHIAFFQNPAGFQLWVAILPNQVLA